LVIAEECQGHYPGVVYQHVNAAILIDGPGHQLAHRIWPGYIRLDRQCRITGFHNVLDTQLQRISIDICADNSATQLGSFAAQYIAKPTGSTGDNDYFSFNIVVHSLSIIF
jgi:hypothetical protein